MDLATYLTQHPKKHLIFDLDSTVLELQIDWSGYRRGIWDTVAAFNRPLTEEVPFEPFKGLELANRAIAKDGKAAEEKINRFVEEYETSHYSGYVPNPSLIDFLHKNKTNYRYYLWTSNTRSVIGEALEKEKLTPLFTRIVTRNDVLLLKPEIDGFRLIDTPHRPKEEYLMIGDNFTDEGAAEKAGIDFFPVDYFRQ